MSNTREEIIDEVDYTVVSSIEIPEEINKIIEEKKEKEFKISYTTNDYTYLIVGYGPKQTSGYSICIPMIGRTYNSIVVKTELLSPKKGEMIANKVTYPVIVIKIEKCEEPIIFE